MPIEERELRNDDYHAPSGAHGMHRGHGGPLHDLLASLFFAGRRRRVYRELARLSGARPGNRVLDVGCGDGYLTRVIAEAVGPAGSTLGVDPSQEAIVRAREVTRAPNCSFATGVAQALDAEGGVYDVVVSALMVHHLPEQARARAFAEMFRVINPGGRVLVAEFRPPKNRFLSLLIRPVTSGPMQRNALHLLPPMLESAGFANIEHGDLRPWIRYVRAQKPAAPTRTGPAGASGDVGLESTKKEQP